MASGLEDVFKGNLDFLCCVGAQRGKEKAHFEGAQ